MARKSQSQQRESRGSQGRSRKSSSTRSAGARADMPQGSSSSRGGSSRSNSDRGGSRGRPDNENWQSQQGGQRDFDRGDYGRRDEYQGQRGYEGDYGNRSNFGGEDYQGRPDQRSQGRDWDDNRSGQSRGRSGGSQQDWGNRGYQSEGYQSRGSGRSRDGNSPEFMPEDRGYDGGREFSSRGSRGYGGGSSRDDDMRQGQGFTRQNYEDWRPSEDQRYSSRSGGGSWGEDRGGFGREGSGRNESQGSFREREYAPERGRSEGYRGDDRFSGYVEGDVRDYHDYGQRNAGGYQNEDEEERYFSGRGPRNQDRDSDQRRGSSSYRSNEPRRRE